MAKHPLMRAHRLSGSAEEGGNNALQRYRNYINKFGQINIFQRGSVKKAIFLACQRVKITIAKRFIYYYG